MRRRKKHWLLIYDIRDPRRLRRIAKKMTGFALRVQKSVFEMDAEVAVMERLRKEVKKIMDYEDYVIFFDICEEDWQKRQKYGCGKYIDTEEKTFYIY
jgi:CRISPR-associated protein Cas2